MAGDSVEHIFMADMSLSGAYLVVVEVKVVWCWVIGSFKENMGCMAPFNMIFEDHVVRSRKSSLYTELAGNVISYTRLHVGLIFFECVRNHS